MSMELSDPRGGATGSTARDIWGVVGARRQPRALASSSVLFRLSHGGICKTIRASKRLDLFLGVVQVRASHKTSAFRRGRTKITTHISVSRRLRHARVSQKCLIRL